MVQGIGGAGNVQSLKNLSFYNTYYSEYSTYQRNHPDSQLSFEGYLSMVGKLGRFNELMENYLETGDPYSGDGTSGNTLSAARKVTNSSGTIYQSEDEETYYQFDYDAGTYTVLQGNEEIAKALGMAEGNNIDTINFGHKSASITDYTFGGLDDGQDSTTYRLNNGNYGGVNYTDQEFDIHYILNALLMDPTDPQYVIAKNIFDDLSKNANQWCPQSDMDELNEVAAQYGTDSAEYKAKLQEVLLKNLDQANEWVEEHTHVENVNAGSLEEVEGSDGTDGTGGTEGSEEESTTGTVPDYSKETVMNSAGVLDDYSKGNWVGSRVSWKNDAGKNTDKCREMATTNGVEYATSVLDSLESSLASQLGEEYTEEIQNYVAKAKTTVLADRGKWLSLDWNSAGLGKKRGFTPTVNTQYVIDKFFEEFNTLCVNKGKTTEEVEAEKKAAEEKAAKEKAGYQNLYNADFGALAQESGADEDVQVVNASSAADIKAKAESEIIEPLKNKLITKYAGDIPASDLEDLLDRAATAALSDCTDWATTTNNYVYNIDSDKLISIYQDNVKQAIKNKGYEF